MPGATAKGYPYALPGDRVQDWPVTSKALSDLLQAQVGFMRWGNAVITTNASGAFNIPLSPALPGVPSAVFYTAGDPGGNAVAAIRTLVAAIPSTWTAALITGNAYRGDNGIGASISCRINYLAIY